MGKGEEKEKTTKRSVFVVLKKKNSKTTLSTTKTPQRALSNKQTKQNKQMEELHALSKETIPAAIEELSKNQDTIKQIAEFCRDAYQGDKEAEVFTQTRDYTTNALLNVAYHVQNIATHVTSFVSAQLSEIEKLDSQIRVISEVRFF